MNTYLLSIGINHYTDHAFKTLSCCENDATNIHEVFKRDLRLGERARKLAGAVSLAQVKAELREIGRKIRNGDTFVFFFSGHGYQHPKCEDQYLLFPEAEAVLVNKGHRDGMLSLSMLCDLTDHWAGVARVFVFDACRSWLPATKGAAAVEVFNNEDALAYIASRDPRRSAQSSARNDAPPVPESQALPPLILNATKNGEVAQELETKGRGVLALAWERTLERQSRNGEVIWLGQHSLENIAEEMQTLLRDACAQIKQTPFMTPPDGKVLLFKPAVGKATANPDETNPGTRAYLEERQWHLACLKNTEAAYESYIKESGPEALHIDEAFTRIEALQEVVMDAKRLADEAARKANAERIAAERAAEDVKQREIEAVRARPAMEKKRQAEEVVRTEAEVQVERETAEAERLRREGEEKARQEADRKRCAEEAAKKAYLQPGRVFRDADWAPEMVVIPTGDFLMGSPKSESRRSSDEGPQRQVKIARSFAIGKYPITQREWFSVMGSNPSHFKGNDLPVETVSWKDAQAYIKQLNEKLGLAGHQVYRLPSEAEWEYSCRAGTDTPFSTGQTISTDQANFDGNYTYNGSNKGESRQQTTPVGYFAANAFGLHDMHGNVDEWVEDQFCLDNLKRLPADGSALTEVGGIWEVSGLFRAIGLTGKVVRGGSWDSPPVLIRSASRSHGKSGDKGCGFRLLKVL